MKLSVMGFCGADDSVDPRYAITLPSTSLDYIPLLSRAHICLETTVDRPAEMFLSVTFTVPHPVPQGQRHASCAAHSSECKSECHFYAMASVGRKLVSAMERNGLGGKDAATWLQHALRDRYSCAKRRRHEPNHGVCRKVVYLKGRRCLSV